MMGLKRRVPMAKVSYLSGLQASTFPGLLPNQVDSWMAWSFDIGDAITVSAHPVDSDLIGNNDKYPVEAFLRVENVSVESNTGTSAGPRRVFFDVRNVGTTSVSTYAIGISSINK
jgi:hypothetical protein